MVAFLSPVRIYGRFSRADEQIRDISPRVFGFAFGYAAELSAMNQARSGHHSVDRSSGSERGSPIISIILNTLGFRRKIEPSIELLRGAFFIR